MKMYLLQSGAVLAGVLACITSSQAAWLPARVPNTTLPASLPAGPPTFGYTINDAFPTVSLNQPVCITSPPGETNRLFILEKGGNIIVITNLANPTRTVFMSLSVMSDGESGLLGLAFHPGYATNGFFFIFSTRNLNTSQGNGRHQRISRFRVTSTNSNLALSSTELPLITQFDSASNHNGGDVHFGPDGYLYASVGDEGPQYNGNLHAQIITGHFFSAILRIDVDKRPENVPPNSHTANSTNYFIPADNHYVGLTNFNGQPVDPTKIRTEFYSIGYRNPWRMSFDPATGLLYVGDVGQDIYEEVSVVTNGANCGWAYYEGNHLAKPLYPFAPTILINPPPGLTFPIQEYPHNGDPDYRGNAVIGGIVYRGSRISQLYGAYVFGDNGSGKVWMLRYNGSNTVPFQKIADASNPSAFGRDPRNGDILIAQLGNNKIGRLDYNSTSSGAPLPPTLADTGAFSDLASLTPNAGIEPYNINAPFWSDNAIKTRWFSVPNTNLTIGFNPDGNWSFPTGSVWIKHFELELTNGVPESRKRLETRFIVRNTNGAYGMTYRWNSATNAVLVPEGGTNESFVINDGGGITRTQIWHYPSWSECLACHTKQGGYALGFNSPQLNRTFTSGTKNQLAALGLAGYFNTNAANFHTLRVLANLTNDAVSLEYRVRSYLAVNCAQCHQPEGPTTAGWDARLTTITPNTAVIKGPLVNDAGNTNNYVIKPGSLANSMLLTRISKRGPGQMPPLGSTVVDTQAVALVSAWITNDLPNYQTFADWQVLYFGATNVPNADANADPDTDAANNYLEYLTHTDPEDAHDFWAISATRGSNGVRVIIPQVANRAFQVQYMTNLSDAPVWSPLNVLSNQPFFPISNRTAIVTDLITPPGKFYRALLIEP